MRELIPLHKMTDGELDAEITHRDGMARWAAEHDCFAGVAARNAEHARDERQRRNGDA